MLGHLSRRAIVLVAVIAFMSAGAATSAPERQVESSPFQFALIGDLVYNEPEEVEFANVMTEIDAEDLAFVIHDGDFKGADRRARHGLDR